MGRSSRRKKSYRQYRRVESFPRSLPTRRLDKNLRDLSLAVQPNLERRQFEPSIQEFPDEFRATVNEKFVVDRNGSPVNVKLAEQLPIPNNRNLQKSSVPGLRYYVSDREKIVPLCSRRRSRRAVLFALRRTGKGSARGKRHVWKEESKIRCV